MPLISAFIKISADRHANKRIVRKITSLPIKDLSFVSMFGIMQTHEKTPQKIDRQQEIFQTYTNSSGKKAGAGN